MAGEPGFEPRLAESESAVLPLNYSPAGTPISGAASAKRSACGLRRDEGHLVDSSSGVNSIHAFFEAPVGEP